MKVFKNLNNKDPIEFNIRFTMIWGNERANYNKTYYFKKEEDFKILFDKMAGMMEQLNTREEMVEKIKLKESREEEVMADVKSENDSNPVVVRPDIYG